MNEPVAIVALGSNLGESRVILGKAIGLLKNFSAGSFRASAIRQTPPVNCPPGSPDFLNAVVAFRPLKNINPEKLLFNLQQIEEQLGRRRSGVVNEPRLLDLDLIAFGEERRETERLVLPHPRAHARRFVLEPLAEILPDYVLPGQTLTVRELLNNLG